MKHSEILETITKETGKTPTQQQLADILDTTKNTIGSRAYRDMEYSVKEIDKISEAFGVDLFQISWVKNKLEKDIVKNLASSYVGEDVLTANYYPEIFGSCGTGTFVPAEYKERIHVPKHCIHNYSKGKNYSVINARGDSMQPYIQDKDLLIFEDYDGEQICDNRIYVFRYGDKIFVKRLILNINQLIIKSDNPAPEYRTITIDLTENTDIQIIGKFAGLMRKAE